MQENYWYSTHTHRGVETTLPGVLRGEGAVDVLLLKGGHGMGKHLFLDTLATQLTNAGVAVQRLWCAGEPGALDGVLAPLLGCGAVDATAPHSLEPSCPGAVERWVDLGRFCDLTALKTFAPQAKELAQQEQQHRHAATHALSAAWDMTQAITQQVRPTFDENRALRRMVGIVKREIPKRPGVGRCTTQLFSAFTLQGFVHHPETVAALCPKVYRLCDRYGLGQSCLEFLRQESRSWDTIVGMDARDVTGISQLLLPQLGLAFLTTPGLDWAGETYRQVHLDEMARPTDKGALRLQERLVKQLYDQAQGELSLAQDAAHQLGALVKPYCDRHGVETLAALEASRWLSCAPR